MEEIAQIFWIGLKTHSESQNLASSKFALIVDLANFRAGISTAEVPEIYCEGSGYFLNIHALRLIFDFKSNTTLPPVPYGERTATLKSRYSWTWCSPWTTFEDVSMGRCMMHHGVWPLKMQGFSSNPPAGTFRGNFIIDPSFVTYHHLEADQMRTLHEEGIRKFFSSNIFSQRCVLR